MSSGGVVVAKQAFIVLGPESSGTRMMARLFIEAGAVGDHGHAQRLDTETPTAPVIVIRRSYPYRKEWPNLRKLAARLQGAGYQVRAVVIVRSLQYTIQSTQRQKHVRGDEKALRRSTAALARIGAALCDTELPFVYLTYESLVQRPAAELAWLFDWAGLDAPQQAFIYDGNRKYEEAA